MVSSPDNSPSISFLSSRGCFHVSSGIFSKVNDDLYRAELTTEVVGGDKLLEMEVMVRDGGNFFLTSLIMDEFGGWKLSAASSSADEAISGRQSDNGSSSSLSDIFSSNLADLFTALLIFAENKKPKGNFFVLVRKRNFFCCNHATSSLMASFSGYLEECKNRRLMKNDR